MPRYRKKPIEVEAVRFSGTNWNELTAFFEVKSGAIVDEYRARVRWQAHGQSLTIHTLEGAMRAMPGDWIIKGVRGEFYPCKPDIFAATYELV